MTRAWHQNFKRKPKEARTSADGITHDSTAEMNRWCKLQFDERCGLVRNLQRQVAYPLRIDDQRSVKTPKGQVAKYTSDFVYERKQANGEWLEVIEDVKGHMDRVAELRIAVFEAIYSKKVAIHKT